MVKRIIPAVVCMFVLAGCGSLRSRGGDATTGDAHVMTVSVMGLQQGPPVEALTIVMTLPEGSTVKTSSNGEVSPISGAGQLQMGSVRERKLTLASICPGGFKGTDIFKVTVFGDPS